MDTFTFLVSVVVLAFAVQFNETWLVLGVLGIMFLTLRSLSGILLLLLATGVLYAVKGPAFSDYFPFIVFGMVILALAMGIKTEPEPPAGGGLPPELMAGLGGMDPYGGGGGGFVGGMH